MLWPCERRPASNTVTMSGTAEYKQLLEARSCVLHADGERNKDHAHVQLRISVFRIC